MPRRLPLVVIAVLTLLTPSCEALPRAADLANARPTAPAAKPQPLPDIERELERQLSRAGSGDSRAKFLRLFGPKARDLARRWYRNMHMFGASDVEASVGLDIPYDDDQDSREPRLGVLQLGFHIPGVHRTLLDGDVLRFPSTRYVVRVQRLTRGGTPRIMRWRPADGPAPWDERDFAVHRERHIVLAVPVVEKQLLRRYRDPADRATRYVRKTFSGLDVEGGPGFLVVVEPDDKRRTRYLSKYASRPPDLDPEGLAVWLHDVYNDRAAGTLTLMQPIEPVDDFEQILVHEMVHNWMSVYEADALDKTSVRDIAPHIRAMSEGYAEWMSRRYADGGIAELIRFLRIGAQIGKIEAELPRNKDFMKGGETTAIAYLVSTSVFAWIADKYNPRTVTKVALEVLATRSYDPFAELKELRGLAPKRGRALWDEWLQNL